MIDIDEVNSEIAKFESQPLTYSTLEKLAWLYIVKDNANIPAEKVTEIHEGSEFIRLASRINTYDLLHILDEHFEVVKTVFPKEYDSIVNRIKDSL